MKIHLKFSDKKDKAKSDVHNNIKEQGKKNEEKMMTLHEKLGNIAAKLHFNSETEGDTSDV